MSTVIDDHAHGHDHAHGPAKGLMRWVLTTNHKDIGSMYLWFAFCAFLLGGSFAMVIRAELFQPGLQRIALGLQFVHGAGFALQRGFGLGQYAPGAGHLLIGFAQLA